MTSFVCILCLAWGLSVFALRSPRSTSNPKTPASGQLFYDQSIPGNVAIPEGLKPLIMQYYPQDYINGIAKGFYDCHPDIPIQDDLTNGRIQCWEQELSANGPDIYIVTYSRCGAHYETRLRIFVKDASGNFHYLWGANPDVTGGTLWDPHFDDIDGDSVKEILLYWEDDSFNTGGIVTKGVLVLAYRNGAIVPITPYDTKWGVVFDPADALPGMRSKYTCTCSDTGVGFVDLDGDGIPELLVYPQWTNTADRTDRVWVTGTQVWKLVNGIYQFQYETPVGTTTPSGGVVGAAIKPASIPLGELESASQGTKGAKAKGGGNDRAITLYVMPPSGYTLDDVDWSTLRIGDFTMAPTADEGADPAPYNAASPPPTMMPVSRFGQTMLQEDLSKPDMAFPQKDADPVFYIGPKGCLHMTTPYHVFGFSKSGLLPWLYEQWQSGASDSPLTTCVSPGAGTSAKTQSKPSDSGKAREADAKTASQGNQHCFTPVTIPIRVDLTNNRGPALGEARIWIDTTGHGKGATADTKEAPKTSESKHKEKSNGN